MNKVQTMIVTNWKALIKGTLLVVFVLWCLFVSWFYLKSTMLDAVYNAGSNNGRNTEIINIYNQVVELGEVVIRTDQGQLILEERKECPQLEESEPTE